MIGSTTQQLAAVAAGAYFPRPPPGLGVAFSPRLHVDGAPTAFPFALHAGAAAAAAFCNPVSAASQAAAAAAAAAAATSFCASSSYYVGHAMNPLHGDLLAKYLDYIKMRAGAAYHLAAAQQASFLTSFAQDKACFIASEKSPIDFVVLPASSTSTATMRAGGVLSAIPFLPPGEFFGPMPQRSTDRKQREHDGVEALELPEPISRDPHSGSGNGGSKVWMLNVRTTVKAEEANIIATQRGGAIYYKTTRAIWRGDEMVLLFDDQWASAAAIEVGGGCDVSAVATATADRTEIRKDEGFQCDRCGKMFAYKYYRDKHLKYTRCVDKGDRKFPCTLCDRSFEKRDRLRIHVLHVHEKHRPHQCEACGKRFSQSSSLNKHTRVHSGERPYKCMYCTKAFTASSILRTHIRQHSGEKPFKCKHCGKAFASHAAHDSHVRRTHKDALPGARPAASAAMAPAESESDDASGAFDNRPQSSTRRSSDSEQSAADVCAAAAAAAIAAAANVARRQQHRREEDIDVVL